MNHQVPTSVFHITHFKNLGGIDEHGILSHSLAVKKGLQRQDISDSTVQELRSRTCFEKWKVKLHDCVPCFFNPRNAMLYKVMMRDGNQNQLVILEISIATQSSSKIFITEGNAASSNCRYYTDTKCLNSFPWDLIWAESWDKNANAKFWMMSEFLVFNSINRSAIKTLHYKDPINSGFYSCMGFKIKHSPELFFN